MCCDHCHQLIQPGTERTIWLGLKRFVRVCTTCAFFLVSAFAIGQASPPEAPPPIMISVGSGWSASGNTSPSTTNSSSGNTSLEPPEQLPVKLGLPLWSSPERQKKHRTFSKENLKLSPADQARLRSR